MQDIVDGLKGYINERLNSPLIASYVFAWIIFNYRVPVLLVSDIKVHVKLAMIDTYLHSSLDQVLYVYGWPAVIACIYVFIAPFPTTVATAWTLFHQNILAKVQQAILRRRIVTEEELAERESIMRNRNELLQQKLHEYEERVSTLQVARERSEAESHDLRQQLQSKANVEGEVARLTESLAGSALQLEQVKAERDNALAEIKSALDRLHNERSFSRDFVFNLVSSVKDPDAVDELQNLIDMARNSVAAPDWLNEIFGKKKGERMGLLSFAGESQPKK